MKQFFCVRTVLALAITAGLTACGAGSKTYEVGGAVLGLSDPAGVVISNNGVRLAIPQGAASYVFPDKLAYGTVFNVIVTTQPPHQTCTVTRGTGSAGTTATNPIPITCIQNSYALGGTITGLTGANLMLNNGADVFSPAALATTFTFAQQVLDQAAYGVTVLVQPTGQVCTVTNGTGTVKSAAVTSVAVNCVNK